MSTYTYDASGNIIIDAQGRQFTFDGDNKQTQVKDAQNNVIGTYFFDGEGKRIKKVVGNDTTVFVYSGSKLIAEYSTETPTQNPTTSWTVTDQLGSPRVIVNSLGAVVSRRDFMPFGEELGPDATYRTTGQKYGQTDSVRQKFTGYQKDEETGLDFAEARMYQNLHGRFTAIDPLLASGKSADPQTFNRYVYVMNNPVAFTDPSGLQASTNPNETIYMPPTSVPACGWGCKIKQGIDFLGRLFTRGSTPTDTEEEEFLRRKEGGTEQRAGAEIRNSVSGLKELNDGIAENEPTGIYNAMKVNNDAQDGRASSSDVWWAVGGAAVNTGSLIAPPLRGGKVTVYISRNADDVVQYAGITNNLARRAGEQLRKHGIDIDPLIENLSRADGRAVEEALIVIHKLKDKEAGTLINKIHSISRKKPEYAERLQRGYELLQTIGYK